ncbi:unnamed protein product [Eruca vesicaria subsp. sativa]|uniref:Ankyrin n=1 Tax=Eruca vesicaria subsp. sativa TaxID=29727 RepID=A0ABC8JMR6_ERUVS|nr:unnamed protein product [Eruca vesicaria subsp. sativa]
MTWDVSQPRHVSASNGSADIVKYLLDWPKSDKVELEAMNTYGETPLHMAARNGCNEAAKLLLDRGAFIQASEGITPFGSSTSRTEQREVT